MNIWKTLGYISNPYEVSPLDGTETGSRLLVGRDKEVRRLQTHWSSASTHASLEGSIGVGKTSLVRVAAYRAYQNYLEDRSETFLLPLVEPFQLTKDENLETEILMVIARTIFKYEDAFVSQGKSLPHIDSLKKWMDNPTIQSGGAGVSVLGLGGNANFSTAINGAGFSQDGFRNLIRSWLEVIFPDPREGSFVGVIDNLELLDTSAEAKKALESMRDTVLNLHAVKWVLCGANGIVRVSVGTQRLTGLVSRPIQVEALSDDSVSEVIRRRLEVFKTREDALPPVSPTLFLHLYHILGRNLRIALRYAQEFSLYAYDELDGTPTENAYAKLMEDLLQEEAVRYEEDARGVGRRAWRLFDELISEGGSISPGDYLKFDFNSMQAMRPSVKQLEDANLAESTFSEEDQRRKTIQITANGWLVSYRRKGVVN